MTFHYGTKIGDFATVDEAEKAAIAKHAHYYTDPAGWLIRCDAVRYAGCSLDANGGENYYTADPALEFFAFPVKRWTPHGATIMEIWSGAKERWVDLRDDAKQWASRSGKEAVKQLAERRRRQIYILNRKMRRAELDLALAERTWL